MRDLSKRLAAGSNLAIVDWAKFSLKALRILPHNHSLSTEVVMSTLTAWPTVPRGSFMMCVVGVAP